MSTTNSSLTIREVKNKILADMSEAERRDTIVGEVPGLGYIILTEKRVFEVYEQRSPNTRTVYVQVKDTQGSWEEYEV